MKALTLLRPWPYAMFRLGKDIENRKWKPWPEIISERIALHAGKSWDEEGAKFIADLVARRDRRFIGDVIAELRNEPYPPMSIVGTMIVTGYFHIDDMFHRDASEWAFGPYCWERENPIELEIPIPCPGALGLWGVPEEFEERLKAA